MFRLLANILIFVWGFAVSDAMAREPVVKPEAGHAAPTSTLSPAFAYPLPAAPVARSNWAVARAGDQVFTFYGLGPGKTGSGIARDAHVLDLRSGQWRNAGKIPVEQGRLASVAVTLAGTIYIIGGYTVSPTGAEVSTPEILRFTPVTGQFTTETAMPVPVDDTVALAWRDRWIVLVSGWHDRANVSDIQIYDTHTKKWITGTPWPGRPVFGHAGGLIQDIMVICDGVTASRDSDGRNHFTITDECWKGKLDPGAIGSIRWHQLPPHPGAPLYRSGAVGASGTDGVKRIVFAGGSNRPYNYNGIGYDGLPSEPTNAVFSYELEEDAWKPYAPLPVAGMDFRGLIEIDESFALFGGMRAGQQVTGGIIQFELNPGATTRE